MTIEQLQKSSKAIEGLKERVNSELLGIFSHIITDSKPSYLSCPSCMKRVEHTADDHFCYKCNTSCDPRYFVNCKVQDHTGSLWVSFESDTKAQALSLSAPDMALLKI